MRPWNIPPSSLPMPVTLPPCNISLLTPAAPWGNTSGTRAGMPSPYTTTSGNTQWPIDRFPFSFAGPLEEKPSRGISSTSTPASSKGRPSSATNEKEDLSPPFPSWRLRRATTPPISPRMSSPLRTDRSIWKAISSMPGSGLQSTRDYPSPVLGGMPRLGP